MRHDCVLSHDEGYAALLYECLYSGGTGWSDLVVGHNAKACRRKHEVEVSDYAEEGIEAHRLDDCFTQVVAGLQCRLSYLAQYLLAEPQIGLLKCGSTDSNTSECELVAARMLCSKSSLLI